MCQVNMDWMLLQPLVCLVCLRDEKNSGSKVNPYEAVKLNYMQKAKI